VQSNFLLALNLGAQPDKFELRDYGTPEVDMVKTNLLSQRPCT